MRILKAYADAGALGQPNYGHAMPAAHGRSRATTVPSRSGDVITISEEAKDMLGGNGANGISVTPQDATYDQRGQIMRQFDNLQGELRALASQFMANGATPPGVMAPLRGMQTRLASLRAQV